MNMKRTKTLQTGSVILEALIAILIFSIGILALVGLQATAINNVADAKYRSTAGFLANQIVGTISATRLFPLDPNGSGTRLDASGNRYASASNVIAATPDPTFACNPCNAVTGNAYTQAWAVSGVAAELPNGAANIAISGAVVTVTINWLPPSAASGVAPHRHVARSFIN